uniref:SH3 and cysteine-rich domain-containing protein-like n=1 Tax=Sinocyclocheilus anshuiensis TaxID=1608454 RepID=A0A671MMT2_9TELE
MTGFVVQGHIFALPNPKYVVYGNRCILYSVLCLFQLQRLKRSLSFKTKSLRSKSADNFFQRPIEDVKFQTELLSDVSSSTGHLSIIGVSVSHIFKKPHFCDVCNHMIVGTNAKLGLRCKACKMGIHNKCLDRVGQQRCMGKLPKGFRRYSSSPLLIQEQFGCIREVMPIACGSKVDPVYETLRFGTSLAQKTKRTSGSESPQRNSVRNTCSVLSLFFFLDLFKKCIIPIVFTPLENGTEHFHISNRELKRDPLQLNTYVALFEFTPQDNQDLEMRPGDRIILADDSNDDWWKGVIEDRIGYFPTSFAHQVRAGDRVFRCNRTFIGYKEQGQITLKEGQICVSGEDEHNGFIRVASGKKRGFVPCDVLENI